MCVVGVKKAKMKTMRNEMKEITFVFKRALIFFYLLYFYWPTSLEPADPLRFLFFFFLCNLV